jgi:predicted transport protein
LNFGRSLYDGGLVEYDQINPIGQNKNVDKKSLSGTAAKEIETFSVEDHLKRSTEEIQDIFQKIREQILLVDPQVKEKPVKNYIGYKINWYNFCSIHFYREKLKVYVRKDKLISDKDKKFTKIPSSYEWGVTPLWWIDVSNDKDLDYIFQAIKESYEAAPDKK